MLDFGAFPPEFNSARIYSGPGSGSLLAAASAWSALAAELNSAALSYENVVTALSSEEWTGTASATAHPLRSQLHGVLSFVMQLGGLPRP